MSKTASALLSFILMTFLLGCSASSSSPKQLENTGQDIRIISVKNIDGLITAQSIEKAFEAAGFSIDGNNDMNKPFSKRFGSTHYPVYRLATVHNADLSSKLITANPLFGLLTPLSMSIWQDSEGNMNIASLTLRGMSRMTEIPMDNPNLITLADAMKKALENALPGGTFKTLEYQKIADPTLPLSVTFTTKITLDEETDILDWKDDFETEFESEMEPVGFLFPGFIDVNEELMERGNTSYEFYDTYSVCKLDVIYPVHQTHPEVGAFAPCTYFLYKKKGEAVMISGFPSVENWITATDIEDKASLDPLVEAEQLFIDIVNSISE